MSQLEALPIAPVRVVFLGDSHVAYGEWSEWLPEVSPLNRGIPGATVFHVSAFAKTLDLSRTTTVVLEVGTNDLLFHTPAEIVSAYRELLRQLRSAMGDSAENRIIICTLPGVNNRVRWTGIDEAQVVELNERLKALAGGGGVEVFDLATVVATGDGALPARLTDDGVHLHGEGYQKWVTALAPHLRRGTTFAD